MRGEEPKHLVNVSTMVAQKDPMRRIAEPLSDVLSQPLTGVGDMRDYAEEHSRLVRCLVDIGVRHWFLRCVAIKSFRVEIQIHRNDQGVGDTWWHRSI